MRKIVLMALCLCLCIVQAWSQARTVTGKVTDEKGAPVTRASIIVKGTKLGVTTQDDGSFSISVPEGGKILLVSGVGILGKEVALGATNSFSITVTNTSNKLEEVVVVAYGKSTKNALTGAVSQVSAKDIEKRALTSVTGVLEGAAPGVMVNNTYGQPGSTPTIRIRGFTSVNGSNTPLFVLDGVIFAGSIADLNPSDIESVSVLKDATAASLYGNRAANGVVVITSKNGGKFSKPSFNVIANQGLYTRGMKEYNTVNANEYMETIWKGFRNNLLSTNPTLYPTTEAANAEATNSLISNYAVYNIYDKADDQLFDANGKLVSDAKIRSGYANDMDWFSPIVQQGHRQDYTVSGGTRSENSSLMFSSGYLDEKGFLKRSRFQRFTGRLNGDITPVSWFKAGVSMNASHQVGNNYNDGNSSLVNPIYNARIIAPIYPVHLHDMTTGEYLRDSDGNLQYDDGGTYARPQYTARHAIWENELNMDRTYRNTLQSQVFADIKFLKDFTFTTRGDLNLRNTENQTYDNATIGDGQGNGGRASRTAYRYKIYTFQQQLNWRKSFNFGSFDVLAGHENYNYYYSYLYGYKTTETFTGQTDLVNFTNITNLTDYQDVYRTESYLGRLRYEYQQKYFLEGAFRKDASSRFNPDYRWGSFWSLSGSWIVSKENFMKNYPSVSYLKLRGGYGEVGNDQSVGMYAHMSLYTMNQNANVAALYKTQNEARNLKWETTGSWNVALEGTLFNRLNFIAEYFDKRSVDLLFDVNLPLSAGATSSSSAVAVVSKNIGTTSNRGWEFSVDADVVRTRDLKINFGVNATLLKNKIISLPAENRANGIITGTKKYMEGHGVYDYWMYQYAGVDQMNGSALYLADDVTYNGGDPDITDKTAIPTQYVTNINGKYYTTNPTYAKRDWSGSAIPDVFGGVSLKVDWKNLSFSTLMTYSWGAKIIDYSYQSLMSMSGTMHNLHKDILNAWDGVPTGITETSANRIDPNGTPIVDFSKSQYSDETSTRFLQDGKYAVLKNVSVGYRLSKSVLKTIGISSCMFNFTIENLATFTTLQGMDPQQSFDGTHYNYFMTPRVFSFGVNVGL